MFLFRVYFFCVFVVVPSLHFDEINDLSCCLCCLCFAFDGCLCFLEEILFFLNFGRSRKDIAFAGGLFLCVFMGVIFRDCISFKCVEPVERGVVLNILD